MAAGSAMVPGRPYGAAADQGRRFRLDDPEGRSGWSSWPPPTLPAEPQAQSVSNTIDPSVIRSITGRVGVSPAEFVDVTDGARSTDITVRPCAAPGPVMIRVNRVLRSDRPGLMVGTLGMSPVNAQWRASPGRGAASWCCGCRDRVLRAVSSIAILQVGNHGMVWNRAIRKRKRRQAMGICSII